MTIGHALDVGASWCFYTLESSLTASFRFLGQLSLYEVFAFVFAVIALILFFKPKKLYGPEYKEEGKVRELDHEPDRSYTSNGTMIGANGQVGLTSQYHSIPEEYQIVIGFGNRYRNIWTLDDADLYAAVEEDDKVTGLFRDITLLYRSGKKKSGGRSLDAVLVGKERFDV